MSTAEVPAEYGEKYNFLDFQQFNEVKTVETQKIRHQMNVEKIQVPNHSAAKHCD